MLDASDPLSGWSVKDMVNTPSGPANADIYGKLYCLLRSTLKAFIARLSASKISLEHFHVNALKLPDYIQNRAPFNRIDVSNIPITLSSCPFPLVRGRVDSKDEELTKRLNRYPT